MPRKRTDRLDQGEPRATRADHWALFELLAGVRRSLERKTRRDEQGPHSAARAAAPTNEKEGRSC
jgi:hypothetical protein